MSCSLLKHVQNIEISYLVKCARERYIVIINNNLIIASLQFSSSDGSLQQFGLLPDGADVEYSLELATTDLKC